MIRLIPAIIIMLYYWLFRIKSYGKLLIFSTETATILDKVQSNTKEIGSQSIHQIHKGALEKKYKIQKNLCMDIMMSHVSVFLCV
jgi:hypothetical protein